MKLAKFIGAAVKAMKNPEMLGTLEEFHKSLIIHLMYLDAQAGDGLADDFQISFRQTARDYLDFLKSIGAELDMPANQEKVTAEETPKL